MLRAVVGKPIGRSGICKILPKPSNPRSKRPVQFAVVGEVGLLTHHSPTNLPPESLCETINPFCGNFFADPSLCRLFVRPLHQTEFPRSFAT